jgi:hypothetical protein
MYGKKGIRKKGEMILTDGYALNCYLSPVKEMRGYGGQPL